MSENTTTVQDIIELEKRWNTAIQQHDEAEIKRFLPEDGFLAVGVEGLPLRISPRAKMLETLPGYIIEHYSFDDIQVHIYGETAVVLILYTQKAVAGGQDRSGQFVLTDIWVKRSEGWRVVERHSSRPEPQAVSRPS